jgi:cytochrome b-561
LVYRLFKNVKKIYVKILHVILHAGALIFSSIGLKAVFDSHNLKVPPTPNFYSTHSWIGILTFGLFVAQWILGFITFLFPKLSENIRRWYLPHHKFWGLVVFCMSCATALMGITEKFIFSVKE